MKKKMKCVWCEKVFTTTVRKPQKGILKGHSVVGSVYCCLKHEGKMLHALELNTILQDIQDDIRELQKELDRLQKEQKKDTQEASRKGGRK